MNRLDNFIYDNQPHSVQYIETQTIKDGVTCDLYRFPDDASRDLTIVHLPRGTRTPRLCILAGAVTIEGYLAGRGSLTIESNDGKDTFHYPNSITPNTVAVHIGQVMQWHAEEDLVCFEICEPPYETGRYQELPN